MCRSTPGDNAVCNCKAGGAGRLMGKNKIGSTAPIFCVAVRTVAVASPGSNSKVDEKHRG